MGLSIDQQDLLPGEAVQISKNANAVIKIDEVGLSRFAFDDLMSAVGMAGREAIGGRLHCTNYRLLFKSHRVNRLRGSFSIFLPTIQQVRNTSAGVKRQLDVYTGTQQFTFIVWGVPKLIDAIDRLRTNLTPPDVTRLADLACTDPGKVGDGLKIAQDIEAVNLYFLYRRAGASAINNAFGPTTNRIEQSSVLNLAELLLTQEPDQDGRDPDEPDHKAT